MNSEAKSRICEIVKKHGVEICRDISQCSALIRENLAAYPDEKELFLVSLRTGIPSKLLNSNRETVKDQTAPRLTKQLESDSQTTEEKARWIVDVWIEALGLLSKPHIVEEKPRIVDEVKEHKVIVPPQDKIIWSDEKPMVKNEPVEEKTPEDVEYHEVESATGSGGSAEGGKVEVQRPETERAAVEPTKPEKKKDEGNAWGWMGMGLLFWIISVVITVFLVLGVGWDGRLFWYSTLPLIFFIGAAVFNDYVQSEKKPGCFTLFFWAAMCAGAFFYWINGAQLFHQVVFGWNMFSDDEIAIFGIRAFWDDNLAPDQLMNWMFNEFGFFAKAALFLDVYTPVLIFISIPTSILDKVNPPAKVSR